ncbi:M48 family metalloprotease [Streptomyces sp. C36]|uniref:M48 family metalloprotease n=1 Tax=Streptomyces sp. C36 TaxID=3237122 RepID=UPI0034C6169D
MTTTLPRTRVVDERSMGAGTTVRFALLVVLLLVSCGYVMGGITRAFSHPAGFGRMGCLLASGGDPFHGTALDSLLSASSQSKAYDACRARYEPQLPWWVSLAWPALLLAVACLLFWGLPAWKARRGRVVPLAAIDHDGAIGRLLEEFAAVAGLARVPRVVVDPAAASTGAVVFGSNRRPTVCLHGGLLARRRTAPEGFRAVLLHEMAHIRHGDVTVTYVTVAVWRAFVVVVLVPAVAYFVRSAVRMSPMLRPAELPALTRGVALMAFMVVLVHLARADVLRHREIYADRAAMRWGADPRGWAVATPPPPRGAARRALAAFAELWRTHPRWDLRRDSLTDSAALFGIRALPLFLTGAAATLINYQAQSATSRWNGLWAEHVRVLLSAGLITAVVGIALWRSVAHAVLTARRVPSGVRAGLWLGAGMAVGELVVDDVTLFRWLPARPEVLALVVLAGGVIVWWTTQCAHLWVRVWRGRTIRPAMLLGLAAMCLVLSAWFAWWQRSGTFFAMGTPLDLTRLYEASALESIPEAYRTTPVAAMVNLGQVAGGPLTLPAVAALWIVPLLAWVIRPAATTPAWVRGAVQGGDEEAPDRPEDAVPSLRGVLLAGVLGGASGWSALVAVMAVLHTRQPAPGQLTRHFAVGYYAWALVALGAAAATAALVASARARRFRLLTALIAAQAATAVAFAGTFVLASSDGCVQPLNTLVRTCGWRPDMSWPVFHYLLGPALLLGALTAVVAAMAVAAVAAVRSARWPSAWSAAPARPPGGRGRGTAARRVWVGALCAAALGVTATAMADTPRQTSRPGTTSLARTPDVPVSDRTRQIQVIIWYAYGGEDLVGRFMTTSRAFTALLVQGKGTIEESRVRPYCASFLRISRDAGDYFRVPDPQAQSHWKRFTTQLEGVGHTCEQATARSDGELLMASVRQLVGAAASAGATTARMDAVTSKLPLPGPRSPR